MRLPPNSRIAAFSQGKTSRTRWFYRAVKQSLSRFSRLSQDKTSMDPKRQAKPTDPEQNDLEVRQMKKGFIALLMTVLVQLVASIAVFAETMQLHR